MNILVTGGAGYIGSHIAVSLVEHGHTPVIVDTLFNSHAGVMDRLGQVTGTEITFHQADICDKAALDAIFKQHGIEAVIHCAGYKAVGESVEKPLQYYHNNLLGAVTLCEVMLENNVHQLIYSSTCTVYGEPEVVPMTEETPAGVSITNPYTWSKYMQEQIFRDVVVANPGWQVTLLRYFNPLGAHPSGLIGEDPAGVPLNLVPIIAQVATGRLKEVKLFGTDYPTADGTCERDYIHIMDLAEGHVAALEHLPKPGSVAIYNLGTGTATSALSVINSFMRVTGVDVPYVKVDRRAGDVPVLQADPSKAERELHWKATRSFDEGIADVWRWQQANPKGYEA